MVTFIHTDLYRSLVAQLVTARKTAGLTQTDLAERLGTGWRQTLVSKIETGERKLDAVEFVVVARAVGANPATIVNQIVRMIDKGV